MSNQAHHTASQLFEQLDHLASPVFVLEPDQDDVPRYVAFNAHARAIAARPLEDYLGRTAEDIYDGAYGRTAFARHCEVLRTGKPMTYEIELPINGITRAIRTTLVPNVTPEGVRRLFGTSVDLTAARESREAKVSLDTMATEMEQFVAMAAHDLRAPMRNMGLIAELLRDGFIDKGDGKLELIEMIEDIANKSMELISDVLSHAHAVDAVSAETTFNFAALCRDICDVLDPQENHRFTYTAVEIHADRTAYQIGLRNLIDNAIKYGNREHLKIDITVQRSENQMLDILLSDNGEGFSESALKFLNGGAFRVESGYGLLGVRRMVQARGGTMSAGNASVGTGAIVRLSLPGAWVSATNSLGDPLEGWMQNTPQPSPKIA